MKRLIVVLAVVVGIAAIVPMAFSASYPTSAANSLTSRVTALEKKVKTLQKDNKDIRGLAAAALLYAICDSAITADALQGTWQTIDQLSAATQSGKTYFG